MSEPCAWEWCAPAVAVGLTTDGIHADTCPNATIASPLPAGFVVHIAGPSVRVNMLIRQRCAWCGVILLDYDLDRLAVTRGQDPTPAFWPEGGLVAVHGGASYTIDHEDGEQLPAGACARKPGPLERLKWLVTDDDPGDHPDPSRATPGTR